MDEPPRLGEQPATEPVAPMSLWARLLNVFAVPGEVFEDVKRAPHSMSPRATIRSICLCCTAWQPAEVADCPVHECPAWPWRLSANGGPWLAGEDPSRFVPPYGGLRLRPEAPER